MLERYVETAKILFLKNLSPSNVTHVEEKYVANFEDHLFWLGGYGHFIPDNYPNDRFERDGNKGIKFRKVRNSESCNYLKKKLSIYELDLHLKDKFTHMPIKVLMAKYNPKHFIKRNLHNIGNEINKDRIDHLGMQHSVVFILNNGGVGANYYDKRSNLIRSYSWSLRPDTKIADRIFPLNEEDVMSDIASEFDSRFYEPRNDNYALFLLPEVVYLGVKSVVGTEIKIQPVMSKWVH